VLGLASLAVVAIIGIAGAIAAFNNVRFSRRVAQEMREVRRVPPLLRRPHRDEMRISRRRSPVREESHQPHGSDSYRLAAPWRPVSHVVEWLLVTQSRQSVLQDKSAGVHLVGPSLHRTRILGRRAIDPSMASATCSCESEHADFVVEELAFDRPL